MELAKYIYLFFFLFFFFFFKKHGNTNYITIQQVSFSCFSCLKIPILKITDLEHISQG